jgi:hypothetical protein
MIALSVLETFLRDCPHTLQAPSLSATNTTNSLPPPAKKMPKKVPGRSWEGESEDTAEAVKSNTNKNDNNATTPAAAVVWPKRRLKKRLSSVSVSAAVAAATVAEEEEEEEEEEEAAEANSSNHAAAAEMAQATAAGVAKAAVAEEEVAVEAAAADATVADEVAAVDDEVARARIDGLIVGRYEAESLWCVEQLLGHMVDERKVAVENIDWSRGVGEGEGGVSGLSGEGGVGGEARYRPESWQGRLVVPGHGIECAWFLLAWAKRVGATAAGPTTTTMADAVAVRALELLEWSWEAGWDDEAHGGGLRYFMGEWVWWMGR